MRPIKAMAAAGAAMLLSIVDGAPVSASDVRVEKGRTLARTYCASCHAIGKVGKSPLDASPPFRTLHERYPVEDLAEALAEGIRTGHPSMPEFRFDPDQVDALITYLKTLE